MPMYPLATENSVSASAGLSSEKRRETRRQGSIGIAARSAGASRPSRMRMSAASRERRRLIASDRLSARRVRLTSNDALSSGQHLLEVVDDDVGAVALEVAGVGAARHADDEPEAARAPRSDARERVLDDDRAARLHAQSRSRLEEDVGRGLAGQRE